jgi:hypothetical protein
VCSFNNVIIRQYLAVGGDNEPTSLFQLFARLIRHDNKNHGVSGAFDDIRDATFSVLFLGPTSSRAENEAEAQ